MWPLLLPALIVGGASLAAGLIQSSAASDAADTQAAASAAGIAEQRRQFDVLQAALAPYTATGTAAVGAQGDLAGINGTDKQTAAIDAISSGPEMTSMIQQGENGLMQNAAATGGLRGGNLQAALAMFRPQVLSQLINQQYTRLSGLTQIGQTSAAGVGTGAQNLGNNVAGLLSVQGRADAAGQLAEGTAYNAIPNAIMAALGSYLKAGGNFGDVNRHTTTSAHF